MFKVRPQDNVVLESCLGCFQIPMRMGGKTEMRPLPQDDMRTATGQCQIAVDDPHVPALGQVAALRNAGDDAAVWTLDHHAGTHILGFVKPSRRSGRNFGE